MHSVRIEDLWPRVLLMSIQQLTLTPLPLRAKSRFVHRQVHMCMSRAFRPPVTNSSSSCIFPSALSFHIIFLLHVSSSFYVLSPFPQKISKSEYDEHKGKSLSFEVNISPSRSLQNKSCSITVRIPQLANMSLMDPNSFQKCIAFGFTNDKRSSGI